MGLGDTNQSFQPGAVRATPPSVPPTRTSSAGIPQAMPQLISNAPPQTSTSLTPGMRSRVSQTPAPAILPQHGKAWDSDSDGPGARLPRKPMRRRDKVLLTIASILLVIILLVLLAAHYLLPKPLPRNYVDMAALLNSSAPAHTTVATLAVHTNWTQAQAVAVANDADHINTLPRTTSQGVTTVSSTPPQFAQQMQTSSGLNQAENGVTAPMDVSVASNAQYMLEAVDGALLVTDNRGDMGAIGDGRFFAAVTHTGFAFGEPRILFDANSQQWIFVVNEVALVNGNVLASYFDVGISTASSPVAPWYVYQINTYQPIYGDCNWGDAPLVGSNISGYFISGTNFKCGVDTPLNGVELWELPKATFAHGKSGPVYSWHNFHNAQGEPLIALAPAVEVGSQSTEWLVGNDAGYLDHGATSDRLNIWAVDTPSTPQAAQPKPKVYGPKSLALPQGYADPPSAQQPTYSQNQQQPSPTLVTGDARITGAEFINGHLYTAFTTAVNWAGDGNTRSGIYWVDLMPSRPDPQSNGIHEEIYQSGIFGAAQIYFFLPAFMADADGNAVLCATASSTTSRLSVVYTSHLHNDPLNTMGGANALATTLQYGASVYTGGYWGDYTGASLVMQDAQHATASLWFATAVTVANPPSNSNSSANGTTTNWSTKAWEITTTGSDAQQVN